MAETPPQNPQKRRRRGWPFLRVFRWTVYMFFSALMLFMAVCLFIGIAGNITKHYPELDLPSGRPASLGDIGARELRDCRAALERMRAEDLGQTQAAFTGSSRRDVFLADYKKWSKEWRKRFEKLGISCRLTEYRYDKHPTLGSLAGIYRRLDDIHKHHARLVKRYVIENARTLSDIHELFERTGEQIHLYDPTASNQ